MVNHHAAQISVTISARNPVRDATVNGLGLLNVLECSRAAKVKKFIFISSGGAVYGEAGEKRLTEDSPPAPVSPYAIHKLLGEHYLRFYGMQHGLEWTALRYSNVFGPRQNPLGEAGVVAIFISKVLAGEIPVINAFPEEPEGMARDYVYVEDVRAGERPGPREGRRGGSQHRERARGPHARAPRLDLPDHRHGS